MQAPVDVDSLVLIAAALLAAGVLVAWVTRWVRVPGCLLFLALGMLVADDGLGLVRFDDPAMEAFMILGVCKPELSEARAALADLAAYRVRDRGGVAASRVIGLAGGVRGPEERRPAPASR